MRAAMRCVGLLLTASLALACDTAQKRYLAVLQPINESAGPRGVGTAEFLIEGDKLVARVDAAGLDETLHPQYIRSGDLCPGLTQDTNGDGLVDVVEGSETFGQVLIPLDGDLSTRTAGEENGFPAFRAYSYQREAPLDVLLSDLGQYDPDIADRITALSQDAEVERPGVTALDLNARTFVILGVLADVPETVATEGGRPAKETLPVLCGNIVEVK